MYIEIYIIYTSVCIYICAYLYTYVFYTCLYLYIVFSIFLHASSARAPPQFFSPLFQFHFTLRQFHFTAAKKAPETCACFPLPCVFPSSALLYFHIHVTFSFRSTRPGLQVFSATSHILPSLMLVIFVRWQENCPTLGGVLHKFTFPRVKKVYVKMVPAILMDCDHWQSSHCGTVFRPPQDCNVKNVKVGLILGGLTQPLVVKRAWKSTMLSSL